MSVAQISGRPPVPTKVERSSSAGAGNGLHVLWSDDVANFFESELLRRECPCATCRERAGDSSHAKPLGNAAKPKRNLLNVVSAEAAEQLDLVRVWPVGNYALGIRWGDGHDSGIYSFDYLRRLRELSAPEAPKDDT